MDRLLESAKALKSWQLLPVLGIGAVAYYLMRGESPPDRYISASALGLRGESLIRKLTQEPPQNQLALVAGTTVHGAIERALGAGTPEVYVESPEIGVRGYIDFLLNTGVPVEIKTMSSKGFGSLKHPLDYHVSQLNFYIYNRKAKYGYLLYVNNENPQQIKAFQIPYMAGRLASDVRAVKEALFKIHKEPYMSWLSTDYIHDPRKDEIRQSSGYAGSWQGMNPDRRDFTYGRIASVVQASRYRPPTKRILPPTMGLTT
ncbi:MAG: hypothetical protein D6732_08225, partial [Methanobacteriota archaeon]